MNPVYSTISAYFLCSHSLPCKIMRKIIKKFILSRISAGARISTFAFDSQWHNIMAKGVDDKPHMEYQFQLSIWQEVSSLTKNDILRNISMVNANPSLGVPLSYRGRETFILINVE